MVKRLVEALASERSAARYHLVIRESVILVGNGTLGISPALIKQVQMGSGISPSGNLV
jgi:hypothetical protein